MVKSLGYCTKTNMARLKQGGMEDERAGYLEPRSKESTKQKLKMLSTRYNAICEHNLVIPEHVDITGEIDKLLRKNRRS
jgi:hypothetical protein